MPDRTLMYAHKRPGALRAHPIRLLSAVAMCALPTFVAAANPTVGFDGGDSSRALLGSGTNVVVGLVDSGVASDHPLLAGNDSLGRPRMVAAANFVASEPNNSGADVYGHGTGVAGLILGRGDVNGVNYDGLAPDARYVDARVLDSTNSFSSTSQVTNGIQFAASHGAQIINLSLAMFSADSSGQSQLDLLVDYLVDSRNILITASAGNNGNGQPPHSPGAARNAFTLGALNIDNSRVATFSDSGPTSDGRGKPDLVAPGTSISTANVSWQTMGLTRSWTGTSFAAPQAAGLAAQMIDYGVTHDLSTDTRVLRAVMMNSADKTLGSNGAAWSHSATLPLDAQQGTGRLDAAGAAAGYLAGRHVPGPVPGEGWSLDSLSGTSTPGAGADVFSLLTSPTVGSYIDATLVWNQQVTWHDFGTAGEIDPNDFFTASAHDELDLYLYRNGVLVAQSISAVDTVQHLHFLVSEPGSYSLLVARPGGGADETYALAWSSVPEPGAIVLLAMGLVVLVAVSGRLRHSRPSL